MINVLSLYDSSPNVSNSDMASSKACQTRGKNMKKKKTERDITASGRHANSTLDFRKFKYKV